MAEHQNLGGTRQSSPLEDEMTYPLTNDEYLTLRENLVFDKFTNWESFLLSTLITTLISGFVIYFSGSCYKTVIVKGESIQIVNLSQVITLIIYGALAFGCLLSLIISLKNKKKAKPSIDRLDTKIMKHLTQL